MAISIILFSHLCNSENFSAVFQGDALHVSQVHVPQAGNFPGDVLDVGRLISAAAVWRRRQVGAVRFDEDAVHGQFLDDTFELRRFGKHHGARKADVKSHLDEFLRHFQAAGIAVKDAADPLAVLAQDIHSVAVGFPIVDIDGHVQLHGHFDLLDEDVLLDLMGRLGPVVIQADFTDGDDFIFRLEPLAQLGQARCRSQSGVFGMDADGGVDLGILVAQGDRFCRGLHIGAGAHHVLYACVDGSLQHGFAIILIGLIIDMAMRVKQHQRTRLPGAMPSTNTT